MDIENAVYALPTWGASGIQIGKKIFTHLSIPGTPDKKLEKHHDRQQDLVVFIHEVKIGKVLKDEKS